MNSRFFGVVNMWSRCHSNALKSAIIALLWASFSKISDFSEDFHEILIVAAKERVRRTFDMDSNQLLRSLDTALNCIHLSAEELQICWGDNSMYWEMVPNHETEFSNKIARLKAVCWFDVKGEVVCLLPPGTYIVSWRAYLSANACGWESDAVSFTFSKKQNDTEDISRFKCYLKRPRSGVVLTEPEPTIRAVGNGWTEYDVGEFAVEAGVGNLSLEFAMVATSDYYWKTGLSLDGVVIRPKTLVDVTVPLRLESSSAGVPDATGGPSNNSMNIGAN